MHFTSKSFAPPPKSFGSVKSFAPKPKPANADAAAASEIELSDLQKDFRARRDQEQERFVDAVDSEFWTCICFQNREQKEAFLKALNLFHLGDKYLNGLEVASVLKVNLPMNFPRARKVKVDGKLAKLAMEE